MRRSMGGNGDIGHWSNGQDNMFMGYKRRYVPYFPFLVLELMSFQPHHSSR